MTEPSSAVPLLESEGRCAAGSKVCRYYNGKVGQKAVRLVYWPTLERNEYAFFEGEYVYERESLRPIHLKISFSSGGRFSAEEFVGDRFTGRFNSGFICDGQHAVGRLCGAWSPPTADDESYHYYWSEEDIQVPNLWFDLRSTAPFMLRDFLGK